MSNRRHFLRSVVLIGAALTARPFTAWAGIATGEPKAAEPVSAGTEAAGLSHEAFLAACGSSFALPDGSRLILDKVSALKRCAHTENFCVWLRRESGAGLAQGTQVFEHATMGRFEMFVVAKTQADGSVGCEAVFNRLLA